MGSFDGAVPEVVDSAYVDESAVVIGDIVVEAEASLWPNATGRGAASGSSAASGR